MRLLLPYEDGGKLAELYELGAPIDERDRQAAKGSSCARGSATPICGGSHPSSSLEEDEASQGTRR